MTTIEILTAYRSVTREISMIRSMQDQLKGRLALHRADKSTTGKLTRKIDRYEGLAVQAEARQASLQADFDRLMALVPDEHLRVILLQYYGMAMTDAEVAEMMDCEPHTVNRYRNRYLRCITEEVQT